MVKNKNIREKWGATLLIRQNGNITVTKHAKTRRRFIKVANRPEGKGKIDMGFLDWDAGTEL